MCVLMLYSGLNCQSPACHRQGTDSISGQFVWDLRWTKWHWDAFFSWVLRFSPVTIIPPLLHTHLHLHVALTRRTNARNLGPYQKRCCFGNQGALGRKVFSLLPYILESNPHPFYSFRGLKNQMWIRIACGLNSRSRAGFWKNERAAVRAVRTIQ